MKMGATIQPQFPVISVQNSMDRCGPTRKVSKKLVHLLTWTTFPGRTGRNFGWKDRARYLRISPRINRSFELLDRCLDRPDRRAASVCSRVDRPHIFTGVKPLKTFYILLHWGELFQGSYSLKFVPWYSLYIADQDTARYSLCSATENCVSWAEPFFYVQQTICSVRAYSCWICGPFMRFVYSKI